jgi:hypothetical protein
MLRDGKSRPGRSRAVPTKRQRHESKSVRTRLENARVRPRKKKSWIVKLFRKLANLIWFGAKKSSHDTLARTADEGKKRSAPLKVETQMPNRRTSQMHFRRPETIR